MIYDKLNTYKESQINKVIKPIFTALFSAISMIIILFGGNAIVVKYICDSDISCSEEWFVYVIAGISVFLSGLAIAVYFFSKSISRRSIGWSVVVGPMIVFLVFAWIISTLGSLTSM